MEVSSESSQSQSQSEKVYSGLLSCPDFDLFHPNKKLFRDVKVSWTHQSYTIGDFLSYGAKIRPLKRASRVWVRKGPLSLSRQSRTFHARLMEYRSILEKKVSILSGWRNIEMFPDIITLSTLSSSIQENVNEDFKSSYGWDNKQAIGFIESDTPIALIGYIMKIAPVDPENVMKLCSNIRVIPLPPKPRFETTLFLEDNTGRIRIELSRQSKDVLQFHEIVSGVPVAIKGISSKGKFWLDDVLFATPPSPEWPIIETNDAVEMVFVSGLHIGSPNSNWVTLSLLFDYLQGLSGSVVEQDKILRPKTRVFFVGNSCCKGKRWNDVNGESLAASLSKILEKLDDIFENLAQTMEVYIIPGDNDPSSQAALPQPPLHKPLFPLASQRPTFQALTNPAKINVSLSTSFSDTISEISQDKKRSSQMLESSFINLVLTSGTNVKETMQSCEIECPLEMSSTLLKWSHLHPTSVADSEIAEEIFSLKSLPHLFVVGGLTDFSVKTFEGVKVVGVPSFAKTGTVMVLTKNCDILPLSFKISLS